MTTEPTPNTSDDQQPAPPAKRKPTYAEVLMVRDVICDILDEIQADYDAKKAQQAKEAA